MGTLLVGYDLDKPGQNYAALEKKLKSLGAYWHCLDSTWMIKTNLTAAQLRDALKTILDLNDKLMVINVTGVNWAWLGFQGPCATWFNDPGI